MRQIANGAFSPRRNENLSTALCAGLPKRLPMIRFISIPSHDALYRLLREECLTAERFVAYCEQRKLKKPEIRKLGYVSHIDLLTLLGGKSANGVRVNNDL